MRLFWIGALLAAGVSATTSSIMPLFSSYGPQAIDVRDVFTTSGWFEVMTTGILMTSEEYLTTNISNINDTHASVRLWMAPPSISDHPEAVEVTIAKRLWSPQSPYAWPATLYDGFHSLYKDDLTQTTMTVGVIYNASQLFYAVYGQAVMEQCARNITGQLLLVEHNTETGPVAEAVTRNDIANDTIQYVYQLSGRVEIGETRRSSWWPNCILFFWRGDTGQVS